MAFRMSYPWRPLRPMVAWLCVWAPACLILGGMLGRPAHAQSSRANRGSSPPPRSRVRMVQDTTRYPWSAICKIIATFPNETTVEGAGTMIGPHHCLTALHLLYDTKTRTAASRVRIIPGYDDERLLTKGLSSHPFGSTHMGQFLFWEPHDIAIIVTSTNIGDLSSWMTVGSRSDRELRTPSYVLGGYYTMENGGERQSTLNAPITRVDGDQVTFNADSIPGLDGGPIFERQARGQPGEQDVWAIVGVQTGTGRGSRIPGEMRRILDRFLHDDFSGVKARIPIPTQ